MRIIAGMLITALVIFGMYWVSFSRMKSSSQSGRPDQAMDTTRARMTLASIAQAEQGNFALKGAYSPLDELVANDGISADGTRIDGYTVSIETHPDTFTVTARCQAAPGQTCPSFAVDQTMVVHAIP